MVWHNFSWGVMALFTYLVPHVSIEIGALRRQASKSPYWSSRLNEAYRHILRTSLWACATFIVIISIVATLVAIYTRSLDPNMDKIIEGMSLFMAAAIFLFISRKVPKWTGFYYSSKREHGCELGTSTRELKFNVFMGVGREFLRIFFLLLPFYCGANAGILPISSIIGILFGFLVDGCIYMCRRKKGRARLAISLGTTVAFVVFGAAVFVRGVLFIDDVWGVEGRNLDRTEVAVIMCVLYLTLAALIHGTMWYHTKKKLETKEHDHDIFSSPDSTTTERGLPSTRDRMAFSLIASKIAQKSSRFLRKMKETSTREDPKQLPAINEEEEEGLEESAASVSAPPLPSAFVNEDEDGTESITKKEDEADEVHNIYDTGSTEVVVQEVDESIDGKGGEEPSYCAICCAHMRSRKANEKGRSRGDKCLSILHWMLWILISLGFTFFVIINLGAQKQVKSTFNLLPDAQELLYGTFLDGPVCAFDDRGPNSNITTFESNTAAHEAGFKVLHCGGCGACSDWENLRIEWMTRNYLAAESAKCAKKSLGGGAEAVNSCLEMPPITFLGECARCWTQDIICTKKHCAFIYLQSQLINKVGNFNVAPGEVTSATCEEAHCELKDGPGSAKMGFVECSGATRRRMDIVSTIERPAWQQCTHVEVDYNDLFGPCCEKPKDFDAVMEKWQELDSLGIQWNEGAAAGIL